MTGIFYTFVLRFSQAALDASLTLVIGVMVAGVFRQMVGPAATRRLFGRGLSGSVRGWAAGMLLPVCSLGVIPVAREFRRSGVPGGVVLAFVLTGPLLNPISFLYGLTLGEPRVILAFVAITLLKTAFVAYLWDRFFGGGADAELARDRARLADSQPTPKAGVQRIFAVFVTAARELASRDAIYYSIGLLGNAVLACSIPHGALMHSMGHPDKLAPPRMLLLSIAAYLSPLSGMMRIGSMFEHGNSIGAAFILLVIGIGMCLGTILWMIRDFGRMIVPWFLVYFGLVLALAYCCEPLLWDSAKVQVDHTHAFDDLSSPFAVGRDDSPRIMREIVRRKLADAFQPPQQLALACLLALLVAGALLRVADPSQRVERWLVTRSARNERRGWDRRLSGGVLGGVAVAGLIVFSVVGAYVYFPDREFCLERMRFYAADTRDLVRQRQVEESIRYLEQWDLLVRQLQVGVYIRQFGVTSEQARTVDDLREALESVRDDLRAGKVEQAKKELDHIVFAGEYRACYACYAHPAR